MVQIIWILSFKKFQNKIIDYINEGNIDPMTTQACFTNALSEIIWDLKYRYRDNEITYDQTMVDSWKRIASALASVESQNQKHWAREFYAILKDFRFIPGGRILAGAGTKHQVTLFNCFVMGLIEDSMESIFENLKEGALTLQQGGGIGYDFSTLRPYGFSARTAGTVASGPVSFMRIWDSMCATLLSTGARRGAMMATLRCDHPDIEAFIQAKQEKSELRHFNLSVLVSDRFIEAVNHDEEWSLVFPDEAPASGTGFERVMRIWSGSDVPVPCRVIKKIPARQLWRKIMRANYDYAEPGVLFIDRINHLNNLAYRESISATNPCGEIPLPPYGACNLGSINLTQFVQNPFAENAKLDLQGIQETVYIAVRILDNVIDLSHFPLEQQEKQARGCRRIGLGLTGLADTLIMLGVTYGSRESYQLAASIMKNITYAAYHSSTQLAAEKGSFPFFNKNKYLAAEFVQRLPDEIRSRINAHGIRNSHLTAIAPTGTISLLANNVSSGIEPVFDFQFLRKVLDQDGQYRQYRLFDYAYQLWKRLNPEEKVLPSQFVHARALAPETHLDMQATLQPFVDNAISKTINVPENCPFADFERIYQHAYEKGLKGCTTFRPNPVTGDVMQSIQHSIAAGICCDLEREAD